jgi:hypothetical protein
MAENELSLITLDTNLNDVEKPPELPAGRYVAEIQDVQIATSGKGNEYFAIKCHIAPDQIPAEMQEHYEEGAIFYWNRQVVPKGNDRRSLFNLKELYKKMGLDPNVTEIDPNTWMGQKIGLVLNPEVYQGETRANVKSLFMPEESAPRAAKAAPAAKASTGRRR